MILAAKRSLKTLWQIGERCYHRRAISCSPHNCSRLDSTNKLLVPGFSKVLSRNIKSTAMEEFTAKMIKINPFWVLRRSPSFPSRQANDHSHILAYFYLIFYAVNLRRKRNFQMLLNHAIFQCFPGTFVQAWLTLDSQTLLAIFSAESVEYAPSLCIMHSLLLFTRKANNYRKKLMLCIEFKQE